MIAKISVESERVLRELGLTGYEVAVYTSLVERGVMSASEVSEGAGVPFSKVYEVLNSLERKGWIDIERGRPSRYFSKPPAEAFESARQELEQKINFWEQTIVHELQPLYEKRELREKPDIWILRGEASVLKKLKEMLGKAKSQVMIAAPIFTRNLAEKMMLLLGGLSLSDIKVMVMVAGKLREWGIEETEGNVEARQRREMFGGGVIVDGQEALLILGEEKPSLVVWSNHSGLVKFARDYFQHLWNSSR